MKVLIKSEVEISEMDVNMAKMLSNGYTMKEIAADQKENYNTMAARLERLKNRMNCKTSHHLVATLFREGVLK